MFRSHAGVGGAKPKSRTCELDAKDKFWMSLKGSPFPTVAEAIQEELEQYRSSEEEVKRLKTSMGIEGDNENDAALSMVSDNTARLTSAVNSLPQLLEKKRLIDMHTTIATGNTFGVFIFSSWSLSCSSIFGNFDLFPAF